MSTNNSDLKLESLFNVRGKVALVTGGATGIGLMCAQALAVNGAKVYVAGRRQDRLKQAAEQHSRDLPDGAALVPVVADVTSKRSIEELVQHIEAKEKCLHILVNNAGVASTGQGPQDRNISGAAEPAPGGQTAEEMKSRLFKPDHDFDTWTDIHRANVASIYFTTVAFLPLLQKATNLTHGWSGCVINITSISGITKISQNHFAYNASKGAAIHLNEILATEFAQAGLQVRVNSIAPGVYPSEMTAMSSSSETNKSQLNKEEFASIPARRPGNDRDMGNILLSLVTNQYINGQTVPADGGYLLVH